MDALHMRGRRPRHVSAKMLVSVSSEVAARGANIDWISQEGATNARRAGPSV